MRTEGHESGGARERGTQGCNIRSGKMFATLAQTNSIEEGLQNALALVKMAKHSKDKASGETKMQQVLKLLSGLQQDSLSTHAHRDQINRQPLAKKKTGDVGDLAAIMAGKAPVP